MFTSFTDLLRQGQLHFNPGFNDLIGLEPRTTNRYGSILRAINNYMYTTYSTNEGDLVMTIEGIVPQSVFIRMEPLLRQHGYYYIGMNPLNKQIVGSYLLDRSEYDPTMNYQTYVNVAEKYQMALYHPPWQQLCQQNGQVILMNTQVQIHYFDFENPLNDLPSEETLNYVDPTLFTNSDPLISIIIEDPMVARISLYFKLEHILRLSSLV